MIQSALRKPLTLELPAFLQRIVVVHAGAAVPPRRQRQSYLSDITRRNDRSYDSRVSSAVFRPFETVATDRYVRITRLYDQLASQVGRLPKPCRDRRLIQRRAR